MFGISGFELLIIAVFILIIFGPDKIPQLAKTVGSAMKMFKSAQADMEKLIRAEMITGSPADLLNPSAKTEEQTGDAPAASTTPGGAATVWAATAEDDEEEDEE